MSYPGAARRARLAVFWIFCLSGVITALWSASLPAINARLHLGETRLGIALLMTGAGAVAVMPLTGRLCDRLGSRAVLRAGAPLTGLTLLAPALAGGFPVLLAAAFVLGAGVGSLDVAMNAHAITVERRYGRSIMSAFHGFWSVGGVLGSAIIATGLHFRASDQVLMAGGAVASALLLMVPGPLLLPPDQPAAGHAEAAKPGPPGPPGRAGNGSPARQPAAAGPRAVVLLLGVVACAGFICEGAAYNWAPLDAIRELRAAPATAALAYTVFATALMTGRFTGDRLHRRLGPVRAIGWAGGTAACGYLLVLLAPSLPAGKLACDYAGWAVAGLGLATVVPAVFSAVGVLERGVGRTLSRVVASGYAGELAGPAVIGPLAGATSLRAALLVPGALALVITVLGPAAMTRATRQGHPRQASADTVFSATTGTDA
jgi:MFS family permease